MLREVYRFCNRVQFDPLHKLRDFLDYGFFLQVYLELGHAAFGVAHVKRKLGSQQHFADLRACQPETLGQLVHFELEVDFLKLIYSFIRSLLDQVLESNDDEVSTLGHLRDFKTEIELADTVLRIELPETDLGVVHEVGEAQFGDEPCLRVLDVR